MRHRSVPLSLLFLPVSPRSSRSLNTRLNYPTRSIMSAQKDTGKKYHLQCTGPALETVNKHTAEQDITLFGSCFCPFVQRAWVAFEYLGIPYKVHTFLLWYRLSR